MKSAMKIILLLFSSILANLHIAQAQQPARLPRIGFVSGDGDLDRPGTRVEHSAGRFGKMVMSKVKTF